jgi:hypothetical protein
MSHRPNICVFLPARTMTARFEFPTNAAMLGKFEVSAGYDKNGFTSRGLVFVLAKYYTQRSRL